MRLLKMWWRRGRQVKRAVSILKMVRKDPRVPLHVKIFAGGLVAYALSPIDLIPDPIPIVGQLDDAVLIPLGLFLILKMIPQEVLDECREIGEGRT